MSRGPQIEITREPSVSTAQTEDRHASARMRTPASARNTMRIRLSSRAPIGVVFFLLTLPPSRDKFWSIQIFQNLVNGPCWHTPSRSTQTLEKTHLLAPKDRPFPPRQLQLAPEPLFAALRSSLEGIRLLRGSGPWNASPEACRSVSRASSGSRGPGAWAALAKSPTLHIEQTHRHLRCQSSPGWHCVNRSTCQRQSRLQWKRRRTRVSDP